MDGHRNNERRGRRGGYKSYGRSRNGLLVPRSTVYRLRRAAQNIGNALNEGPANANRDQVVENDEAVLPDDEVSYGFHLLQ
jgi:hypothetical protein